MLLCPLAPTGDPAADAALSPAAWRLHCVTVASMLATLAAVVTLCLLGAA